MTLEWIAQRAYQNGDKALQKGWWAYVLDQAVKSGYTKEQLIAEVKSLSEQRSKDGG